MSNDPVINFIDDAIQEIKIFIKDSLINIGVLVFIFAYLVTPTATPTTSMVPTISTGDWILLIKFPYGFNIFNLDMSVIGVSHNYFWKNLTTFLKNKKFLPFRQVKAGDIISFRINGDYDTGFLKRVIAVENQTIAMSQGDLYIDGKKLPRTFLRKKTLDQKKQTFIYYNEKLNENKQYQVRYIDGLENHKYNNFDTIKIPQGYLFAMGDNRHKSDDSRDNIGLVPMENIAGKGFIIFFSKGKKLSLFTIDLSLMVKSFIQLPKKIKWKRIFTFL